MSGDPTDFTKLAELWARRAEKAMAGIGEMADAGAHISGEMAALIAQGTATLSLAWSQLAANAEEKRAAYIRGRRHVAEGIGERLREIAEDSSIGGASYDALHELADELDPPEGS